MAQQVGHELRPFEALQGSNIHGRFQTGHCCAGHEGQHGSPAKPRFFGLLVLVDRTDLSSRKLGRPLSSRSGLFKYNSKQTVKDMSRANKHRIK